MIGAVIILVLGGFLSWMGYRDLLKNKPADNVNDFSFLGPLGERNGGSSYPEEPRMEIL